jgi:hypothetical protein
MHIPLSHLYPPFPLYILLSSYEVHSGLQVRHPPNKNLANRCQLLLEHRPTPIVPREESGSIESQLHRPDKKGEIELPHHRRVADRTLRYQRGHGDQHRIAIGTVGAGTKQEHQCQQEISQ